MRILRIANALVVSMFVTILFLASCTNDFIEVEEDMQGSHTVRMTFEACRKDFEAPSARSVSNTDWKKGDILYVRFHTSKGIVIGNATYDDNGGWVVNYTGVLDRNSEMPVEITFFDDSSLSVVNNTISLTENTAIYQDIQGRYKLFSNGELVIIATLKPLTSRIRFKGEHSDNINIGGLETNTSYDIKNGVFSISDKKISPTINLSGYTDYIYGVCSNKTTPQIRLIKQGGDDYGYMYILNCTEGMMAIGRSGWMNIPTPTSHNGWTIEERTRRVDLGLPSGLKWASCNVGAMSSTDYGDYFAWGETQPTSSYSDSKTYGKSVTELRSAGIIDDAGNLTHAYDAARANCGQDWRMPTKVECQELIEKCSWMWTTMDGNSGYRVTGPNGMYIFLPAAGYRNDALLETEGVYGRYWSASINDGLYYAASLNFDDNYSFVQRFSRYRGLPVRPVSDY